jgi:hypothetical protein
MFGFHQLLAGRSTDKRVNHDTLIYIAPCRASMTASYFADKVRMVGFISGE